MCRVDDSFRVADVPRGAEASGGPASGAGGASPPVLPRPSVGGVRSGPGGGAGEMKGFARLDPGGGWAIVAPSARAQVVNKATRVLCAMIFNGPPGFCTKLRIVDALFSSVFFCNALMAAAPHGLV